jgi:hypothetical protein
MEEYDMKYLLICAVVFAISTGFAFADGTLISSWEYTASDNLFGLALHDNTGNLWCIDYVTASPGFYEYSTSGTPLSGAIPARDVDSTQDGAWNLDDNQFIVGYYTDNLVDVYDGANGNFLASLDGPGGFTQIWGVAFDDVSNTLYVGEYNRIAYGTYVDENTPINWTIRDAGNYIQGEVTGLGTDGTNLYGVKRDTTVTEIYCLVWELTGGVPGPYFGRTDITEHFLGDTTPSGGCAWDGNHLWVVDQAGTDRVLEIELGTLGIRSASLGEIKARFK